MNLHHEVVASEGGRAGETPILEPLTAFRDHLLVLSGPLPPGGHPQPGEAGEIIRVRHIVLDGVHPKQSEGADLQAGTSLDQIAARNSVKPPPNWPSLELSLDLLDDRECETGYSCAYTNTLSWRTPTTPMPMENQPRAVFENLFGDSNSTDPKVRLAESASDRASLTPFSRMPAAS